jgi:hypothetical protein
MSARKDITSYDSTVLCKIFLPGLFFFVALVCNIFLLFNIGELWHLTLISSAMTVWLLWYASRLKWVSVDENFVYASGVRKEIRIPLSEVESVDVSYMQNPKRITLQLKSPTEFGRKIAFIPRQRLFESMRDGHPVADELRALLKAHGKSPW